MHHTTSQISSHIFAELLILVDNHNDHSLSKIKKPSGLKKNMSPISDIPTH